MYIHISGFVGRIVGGGLLRCEQLSNIPATTAAAVFYGAYTYHTSRASHQPRWIV